MRLTIVVELLLLLSMADLKATGPKGPLTHGPVDVLLKHKEEYIVGTEAFLSWMDI